MTTPTVSIIMAAYNGTTVIKETIDSILAQTFRDFELIIVDDCSKDATLALLRAIPDPRVRVIPSDENRGPVRTRNHAFALARGRYVAGLDQDDICLPQRLERQVAWLDNNPSMILVATAAKQLKDGKLSRMRGPQNTTPAFLKWLLHLRNPLVW